jgi:hypothetical protein
MSSEVSEQEIERELQTLRSVHLRNGILDPADIAETYVAGQHLLQVPAPSLSTRICLLLRLVRSRQPHPLTRPTTTSLFRLPMGLMMAGYSGYQRTCTLNWHRANSETF